MPVNDKPSQLLRFAVGPHSCALATEHVREVLRMAAVTRIPEAPASLEGVLNLRGAIIPILDLRKRFGLPVPPPDRSTRIIVVPVRGRAAGFIVSGVSEVASLEAGGGGIDPGESLGSTPHFVSRVVRVSEELVLVLDPEKALTAEESRAFDTGSAEEGLLGQA